MGNAIATTDATTAPLVEIGWVYAGDPGADRDHWDRARRGFQELLVEQFPNFRWATPVVERPVFTGSGPVETLVLAETVLQEKLTETWDFGIGIVPNELQPRAKNFMIGAPSSALEIAVVGARRLGTGTDLETAITALALHLLGHIWGLEHRSDGPMRPPGSPSELQIRLFDAGERDLIIDRLEEVSDPRLEESPASERLSAPAFYLKTLAADPKAIVQDVVGYAPWKLPLRLRRMTGAAAAPMLLLLLGAEAWEMGSRTPATTLAVFATASVGGATVFMFLGQRLNLVTRELRRTEQVARSQIVLFLSLLAGVFSLFATLWSLTFIVASAAPDQVVEGWAGGDFGWWDAGRLAAFMAAVGVIAGALGGTLEETSEIKAHLFLDEET